MFKFLIPSIFVISVFALIYPGEKENTTLTDYCFSLEKIVVKNAFDSKKIIGRTTKMIANGISSFGVENSRGDFITNIIDTFKLEYEDSFINLIPTKIYCFGGYWIKKFQPNTFEFIFFEILEKVIEESYEDLKSDIKDNLELKRLLD